MLFVVRFTDLPGQGAIRAKFLQQHIDWLAERQAQIKVAGSLRHELGETPVGALWILEADSKAAVEAAFQSDPFWQHGLRQSVEIYHWSKALPDVIAQI